MMEFKLSENLKQFLMPFLLVVLPLIVIGLGLVLDVKNGWYFITAVSWFATGLIFQTAID